MIPILSAKGRQFSDDSGASSHMMGYSCRAPEEKMANDSNSWQCGRVEKLSGIGHIIIFQSGGTTLRQ